MSCLPLLLYLRGPALTANLLATSNSQEKIVLCRTGVLTASSTAGKLDRDKYKILNKIDLCQRENEPAKALITPELPC
jgi:hypothetical protein